jgi:hypothetical protein
MRELTCKLQNKVVAIFTWACRRLTGEHADRREKVTENSIKVLAGAALFNRFKIVLTCDKKGTTPAHLLLSKQP